MFGLPFGAMQSSVVVVGVPWEATTSYGRGTANGPKAVREASIQLDLYDPEFAAVGLARPWVFGMHMLALDPTIIALNQRACALAEPIVAAGGAESDDPNLQAVNRMSVTLNDWVRDEVCSWQAKGKLVGIVGGDHSVSLGAIAAAATATPGLGILHIDAHADLRVVYEGFVDSHASVMHRVLASVPGVARLVQVGVRDLSQAEAQRIETDDRISTVFDHQIRAQLDAGHTWAAVCAELVERLPQRVYVSFDIDGLDPSLCPNTGTPVPGGLSFGQALTLLRVLAVSGRQIVGFDLVEVAPSPVSSERNQWDGNVGARILYRLCTAAVYSQGARDPA